MNLSKASSRDGFQARFYQIFWHVVGQDVTMLCLECLNDGWSVERINHTVLYFIPKVKQVERMSELRPISLCNVIYKCILKALANCMRKVLDGVISETQSVFVIGRVITDNVMVGFECMHALHRKVIGKWGFMALKLDISKAYNRMEWVFFLEEMMCKIGFSKKQITKIMNCVSSVSFSYIIKGKLSGYVRPLRGLRQGDLLSPYLFLLCVEGLSGLMSNTEKMGKFSGFWCNGGGGGPHLFFC
jgi:hypothetical protein